MWTACVKLAPQVFGPGEILLGPASTQFGLVGLATFSFWASQIKEIGVSKDSGLALRWPSKSLGQVRQYLGQVVFNLGWLG